MTKRGRAVRLALLTLAPWALEGNGGGYITGSGYTGSFQPSGVEEVEMRSERLLITLYPTHAEVDVEYVLHHPGSRARTVTAGFPCTSWGFEGSVLPAFEAFALEDLTMALDGQALEWELRRENAPVPVGGPKWLAWIRGTEDEDQEGPRSFDEEGNPVAPTWVHSWHVVELPFAPGQSRQLRVNYACDYRQEIWSVSDNVRLSAATFSYVLSSAASWRGPIGEGQVEIRVKTGFPDEFAVSPDGRFRQVGDRWVWNFENLEPGPEDDLGITAFEPWEEYPTYNRSGRDGDDAWGVVGDYQFRKNGYYFRSRYAEAAASSTLPAQGNFSYDAENVLDGQRETSWVEGAPGDGIGESLTIELKRPIPVDAVSIFAGFGKSRELFRKNNRIARLLVRVNGGEEFPVSLDDVHGEQVFPLPDGTGEVETIVLRIGEVYRGTTHRDTCVSSLAFHGRLKKKPSVQGAR